MKKETIEIIEKQWDEFTETLRYQSKFSLVKDIKGTGKIILLPLTIQIRCRAKDTK